MAAKCREILKQSLFSAMLRAHFTTTGLQGDKVFNKESSKDRLGGPSFRVNPHKLKLRTAETLRLAESF